MKRRFISLVMLMTFVLSCCLSGWSASAEEAQDFDSQIQKAETAKQKAESKIKELKKDLSELEGSKGDLLKFVKKVDKKIANVSDTLEGLHKQTEDAKKELSKLEEAATIAENEEKDQYETMKKRIKYMYENGGEGYIDVVFSAGSLGEFLNRSEYVEKISKFDSKLFDGFMKTKNDAIQSKAQMEHKLGEIESLKDDARAEKDALKKLKSSKKQQVDQLDSAISSTDSKVKTFNEQVAKQEQKVENLLLSKQRQIAQQEAKQRASNKSTSNKGGNTQDAQPATDSYAASSGALRWPLKVKGRISSKFGGRTSPTEGASTYHRGLDIAVSAGTQIVAAAKGTVVTATYSTSAGNYIMIYHGNSLYTVYMHCSKLAVKVGDKVEQGSVIGYVGSTGVSTGSHLHFGVSVNGAYVDPLNYVSP